MSIPNDAPCPRLCHLIKWPDFNGYGFHLHAEKSKQGQYIGKVDDDSPAMLAGLREGDKIIEVNFVNICNENHRQVVERIKSISNETRLLVIDDYGDRWYRERKIVIKSSQPNVICYRTPVPRPELGTLPVPASFLEPNRNNINNNNNNNINSNNIANHNHGSLKSHPQQQQQLQSDQSPSFNQKQTSVGSGSIELDRRTSSSLSNSNSIQQNYNDNGSHNTISSKTSFSNASDNNSITDSPISSNHSSFKNTISNGNQQQQQQPQLHHHDNVMPIHHHRQNHQNIASDTNYNNSNNNGVDVRKIQDDMEKLSITSTDRLVEEKKISNSVTSNGNNNNNNNRATPISTITSTTSNSNTNTLDSNKSSSSTTSSINDNNHGGGGSGSASSSNSNISGNGSSELNLNMTAAEMRQLIAQRKKKDVKKTNIDLRKKYEIIQQM